VAGACALLWAAMGMAQDMPSTTKEKMKGAASVKTEQIHGTVVYQESGWMVVKLDDGSLKEYKIPPSRKFMIDGKAVTLKDLQPGTTLTATTTTTTTPVTQRTTTIGSGKVWFVSGNTVIVTLPNNENREYTVDDNFKFMVNGQPAGVHNLKKGMTVSAEKIVEEPMTEVARNTVITGQAPAK
jgi:hypothetical protein